MPIPFTCACGHTAALDDDLGGKLAPCPRCGELQRVGGAPRRGVRAERREEAPYLAPEGRAPAGDANPYSPPRSGPRPRAPEPEPTHQEWPQARPRFVERNVVHEEHVIGTGMCFMVMAALTAALGVLVAINLTNAAPPPGLPPLATNYRFVLGIYFGMALVLVSLGYGLTRLQPWARWATVGLLSLQVLAVLAGLLDGAGSLELYTCVTTTAYNGAVLWALCTPVAAPLFRASYREQLVHAVGGCDWKVSPFFWGPLAYFVFTFALLYTGKLAPPA